MVVFIGFSAIENNFLEITANHEEKFKILAVKYANLTEKTDKPKDSDIFDNQQKNISAVLGTETIYAAHKAVVGREGLFVISQKPLKINADGSEISELALTATKFQNTYLETDQEALTNIKTIFEPENETAKKAFETAIVDFGADSEWRDI